MKPYHDISYIHQIFISDCSKFPKRFPEIIRNNIHSIKELYPYARYKLWSNHDVKCLIKKYFSKDVLDAYNGFLPYSYKADLAKFLILYIYGGLYVDLGVRMNRQWKIPYLRDIAAFRDVAFTSASWPAIQTGLLWALPKRAEFKKAVEWTVENCKRKYYGDNPLYPTGPVLLGRVFISEIAIRGNGENADNQHVGMCRCVTPESSFLNMSYVSKGGEVIAFRHKRIDGDLTHLGLTGTNNYNTLWHERRVYGEHIKRWSGDDDRLLIKRGFIRENNSLKFTREHRAFLYGPYVNLCEGLYEFSLKLLPGSSFSQMCIDVISECGRNKIKSYNISKNDSRTDIFSFNFELNCYTENIEFLVSFEGATQGGIDCYLVKNLATDCVTYPTGKKLPPLNQITHRISRFFSAG